MVTLLPADKKVAGSILGSTFEFIVVGPNAYVFQWPFPMFGFLLPSEKLYHLQNIGLSLLLVMDRRKRIFNICFNSRLCLEIFRCVTERLCVSVAFAHVRFSFAFKETFSTTEYWLVHSISGG